MRRRERVPEKEGKRAAIITLWLLLVAGPLLWLLWTLNQLNQGMQCFLGC